jgi:predicted outer membrane repeat protein
MSFSTWLRNNATNRARRLPARPRHHGLRFCPQVNALEDRIAPSSGPTILPVDIPGDVPKGHTLRNAVLTADKYPDKTFEIDINFQGTINLESSLVLANNITIKGLGASKTLIERDPAAATPLFRIVTVEPGFTVTLEGLSIANGNAGSGNGGAIDNFGTMTTLKDCALYGNFATNGGAVENEPGAGLTVDTSSLNLNHATSLTQADSGGAIDNNGMAQVSNSAFMDNESDNYGGAIYNRGSLTISSGTSFTGNSAAIGGAIDNYYGAVLPSVSGATFSGNTAVVGGALANYGSATVSGSTFTGNQATGAPGSDGGAIWNAGSLTVQGNSAFSGDSATGFGGEIMNFGTTNVSQSTFAGTSSGNSAGSGGAIENWYGANLTIAAGTSFTGLTANYGGAIDSQSGTTVLSVTGATFSHNTANIFGGAIDTHTNGATFSDCTFAANQALGSDSVGYDGGGAIWNDGSVTIGGYSSFSGNTATEHGGAIDNFGTAVVSQTTFTNTGSAPEAGGAGGAIMNQPGANLTLNAGTSFGGNTAGDVYLGSFGGAIFNYGTLTATGASFSNNTAIDGGAIANFFGATSTFSGCTFAGNHSNVAFSTRDTVGGGAIWNGGSLTVQGNSTFYDNTATEDYGGAIFNGGTATVSQTTFTNNGSTPEAVYGGAIYNALFSNLTINPNTSFTNNVASDEGGAIRNDGTLTDDGASFNGNGAQNGGAIYNNGAATLSGGSFAFNFAFGGNGGAIENTSGTLSVSGSDFFLNSAHYGGAIHNGGGTLTVSGCKIHDNGAALGGGLYNALGTLTLWGSDVESNSASNYGGGIYTGGSGITNVLFGSYVANNNDSSGADDTYTESTAPPYGLHVDGYSYVGVQH